jgi:hypothetical protein
VVYMDDLFITGSDYNDIKLFNEMASAFNMSELSLLHYYLNIEMK